MVKVPFLVFALSVPAVGAIPRRPALDHVLVVQSRAEAAVRLEGFSFDPRGYDGAVVSAPGVVFGVFRRIVVQVDQVIRQFLRDNNNHNDNNDQDDNNDHDDSNDNENDENDNANTLRRLFRVPLVK